MKRYRHQLPAIGTSTGRRKKHFPSSPPSLVQVRRSDPSGSYLYLSFALRGAIRLLQPLGHFIGGLLLFVRRALRLGLVIQDVIYRGKMVERIYRGSPVPRGRRNGNSVGVSGVGGDVYFVCLFLFFKSHTATNTNGVTMVQKIKKMAGSGLEVEESLNPPKKVEQAKQTVVDPGNKKHS